MALLLAMYQKMRLTREKNQLALDSTKISSQLSRIEKNIANQNKRYASLFTQLENQSKTLQNNANMFFQNIMGLGYGSVNPMDYTGLNANVANNVIGMMMAGGYKYKDADGVEQSLPGLSQAEVNDMMAEYMANGGNFIHKKDPNDENKYLQKEYEKWSPEQVAAFNQALQMAKIKQQQDQMWVNNANTQYGNNISIWLEAEKARLEAEQDAVLAPLTEKQTDLQTDKEYIDTKMTRIDAELQAYKDLCSQEAKNAAPTFGLR